jgi:hypothetical protein
MHIVALKGLNILSVLRLAGMCVCRHRLTSDASMLSVLVNVLLFGTASLICFSFTPVNEARRENSFDLNQRQQENVWYRKSYRKNVCREDSCRAPSKTLPRARRAGYCSRACRSFVARKVRRSSVAKRVRCHAAQTPV